MMELFNDKLIPNSFAIECYSATFVKWYDVGDLVEIFSENPPHEWLCLGGGNNTLFCADYKGTLINGAGDNITIIDESELSVAIRVEAGREWDELVEWCCQRGYWGVENLSLIPGHCGAAPIQNIGAYGVEVKDVIDSVEVFSVDTLKLSTLKGEECSFGYRDSIFKRELKGRVIVTAITLTLSKIANPKLGYKDVEGEIEALGGGVTLQNIRRAICSIRERKLPSTKEVGSAGSFFKNPVVARSLAEELKTKYPDMPIYPAPDSDNGVKLAAGWLIDRAGFKGYRQGCVGVHDKQALVLINIGGATGHEVLELAHKIQHEVAMLFGVEIDMEVNVIE